MDDSWGLPKLARSSMTDRAYQAIRTSIMEGRLRPSERIVIDRIGRDMDVSPGPVREALARLSAERLVQLESNKGYRVAPALTEGDVSMWQEARLILECGSVRRAAINSTPADIKALRGINHKICAREFGPGARSVLAYMAINDAFHMKLMEMAANDVLLRMYNAMHYGSQVTRNMTRTGVTDRLQICEEHDRIIAAVERHDPDAASTLMRDHIVHALERVRQDV